MSKPTHTTPCEYCGKSFTSRRTRATWTRFCSKSCARKAQLAAGEHPFQREGSRSLPRGGTPEHFCEECGGAYRRQATRPGRFCSRECYLLASARTEVEACRVFSGVCPHCGAAWSGQHPRVYCSRRCSNAARWRREVSGRKSSCNVCGVALGGSSRKQCSDACRSEANRRSRSAYKQRRRAMKKGAGGLAERVVAQEIFERDGWLCGICRRPIDPFATYPSRRSASLDHVVPLSWGGAHVALNVQAAHLGCNMDKGARVGHVQPLLIG